MGFSCVICITTDTKGTERKKTGIMRHPKGLMLRKKRPAKRYQRRGARGGRAFSCFFHFLLHEAGFTADLDGSCELGRGSNRDPHPLMSLSLLCRNCFSIWVSQQASDTHNTTGRRDGTARTGGVETKREQHKYYLPLLPTWHFKLSSSLCRHSYQPVLASSSPSFFFPLLLIMSRCLSVFSDQEIRVGFLVLHM